VHLLVRGSSLDSSMSYYLIQQIAAVPNITVHTCTEVVGGEGDGHLERLNLRNNTDHTTETVATQWLFVFIGAAPRTEWLDGVVARDDNGFVIAGPDLLDIVSALPNQRPPYHLETSVPGVFVAGDARSDSAKRVASAVGEGAMAVMLVHRYLETR
jgi:thioredoxin reductase (NADPH)